MDVQAYIDNLVKKIHAVTTKDKTGASMSFVNGVEKAVGLISDVRTHGKKLIFIGNGASAAMASHMSVDFWKNVGVKAIAFNDAALLTCMGNDYGYPHVFEKPIEMFADQGDIVLAISSSGKSENIVRAVAMAQQKGCLIITLSGFKDDNPLSKYGAINFYVPDTEYGPVEVIHQAILHCLADMVMSLPREGK